MNMKRRDFLKFVGATCSGALASNVTRDLPTKKPVPMLGTRANPWPMSIENARYIADNHTRLGIPMEYVSRPLSERRNGVPLEVRLRYPQPNKWTYFLVVPEF